MPSADAAPVRAVLFDFSGTLANLESGAHWFDGMDVDDAGRAEVMDRMTHPTASSQHPAWPHRDLDPESHRQAYLHVLGDVGLAPQHAEALYERCVDPDEWQVYPDAVEVLDRLRANGIRSAVVSNIAWDVRRTLAKAGARADEYVLSYEVGAAKPDPRIFEVALQRLGVDAAETLMVGDSVENDGAAREIGCRFVWVDPLPVAERPAGLVEALRAAGVTEC